MVRSMAWWVGVVVIIGSTSVARADAPADKEGFVPMFNGTDLSGWVPCNVASGTKPPLVDTFTVKDGMIVCTGVPTGVLRTERMYENFVAELEWRHMVPKGNSGFFLWADDITSRGVPFSRGLEVQILDGPTPEDRRYTTHGDLFPIHGATAKPDHPGKWGMRSYPIEDRSKMSPEWNHYRVEAIDGNVTLSVNGKVVNSTKEVSPRKGYLCLESEGGVIHFRNLRIKELPPGKGLDAKDVAIADRGYVTLYNGLSLDGLTFADGAAKGAWSAVDWALKFDPARLPAVHGRAIDPAVGLGEYASVDLIFDVKTEGKLDIVGPAAEGIALPAAAKESKVKKGWRRVHLTVDGAGVKMSGEDFEPVTAKRIAGERFEVRLRPAGAAEFANLYVKKREVAK